MPFTLIHKHNNLVKDKISRLRDERTDSEQFIRLLDDLTALLAFHVCQDLPVADCDISTPKVHVTKQPFVLENDKTLVFSLFRAAIPMAHRFKKLLPKASIVHVVYSNKSIVDVREIPKEGLGSQRIVVVDPIIGTGGSVLKLIELIEAHGVLSGQVRVVCIAAATKGIKSLLDRYPELEIVAFVEEMNIFEDGYLNPGFGDVGNRVYGLSE